MAFLIVWLLGDVANLIGKLSSASLSIVTRQDLFDFEIAPIGGRLRQILYVQWQTGSILRLTN